MGKQKSPYLLLTVFCVLTCSYSFAFDKISLPAQTDIDSLNNVYENASTPVDRIETALEISRKLEKSDNDKSWFYARKALEESVLVDYDKGLAKSYFRLGKLYTRQAKYDSSIMYLEKSLKIFEQSDDSVNVSSAFHSLGISHYFLSNYDTALTSYNSAAEIYKALGHTTKSAGILFNIGLIYRITKRPDSAIHYFERSLEFRRQENNVKKITKCYTTLSSITFDKGEYDKAQEYMQKAIDLEKSIGDSVQLALIYLEMGRMNQVKDDFIKSVENYSKALKLTKATNQHYNESVCYINIGESHRILKHYETARYNYLKSLEIRKRIKNRNGVATCYLRLGQLDVAMKQFDSAADYFKSALDIYTDVKNMNGIATATRNIGALLTDYGQLDSSIQYLKKSTEIYTMQYDDKGRIESELYLAIALYERGDKALAKQKFLMVYNWSVKNDHGVLARGSANELANLTAAEGDFELAYFYRTKHKEYHDRILSAKNIAQTSLQDYKYKSEKKEQARKIEQMRREAELTSSFHAAKNTRNMFVLVAIMMLLVSIFVFRMAFLKRRKNKVLSEQKRHLNQQNKELQTLSEQLKVTLEEKNTLLKEVHHRVKNNLQVILSLLNTQVESLDDDQAVNAILDSQNRIKAMVLVHQNIYQSNDVSVVKSDQYIREMISSIYYSQQQDFDAEFSLQLAEVSMELNQAIPVGLIINELVTNCFKYAFDTFENDNHNKLTVSLSYDQKQSDVKLNIKDNGKGMCSEEGTAVKGFGLELVRGLTAQLGGELNIDSRIGLGTSVEVMFKLIA